MLVAMDNLYWEDMQDPYWQSETDRAAQEPGQSIAAFCMLSGLLFFLRTKFGVRRGALAQDLTESRVRLRCHL